MERTNQIIVITFISFPKFGTHLDLKHWGSSPRQFFFEFLALLYLPKLIIIMLCSENHGKYIPVSSL